MMNSEIETFPLAEGTENAPATQVPSWAQKSTSDFMMPDEIKMFLAPDAEMKNGSPPEGPGQGKTAASDAHAIPIAKPNEEGKKKLVQKESSAASLRVGSGGSLLSSAVSQDVGDARPSAAEVAQAVPPLPLSETATKSKDTSETPYCGPAIGAVSDLLQGAGAFCGGDDSSWEVNKNGTGADPFAVEAWARLRLRAEARRRKQRGAKAPEAEDSRGMTDVSPRGAADLDAGGGTLEKQIYGTASSSGSGASGPAAEEASSSVTHQVLSFKSPPPLFKSTPIASRSRKSATVPPRAPAAPVAATSTSGVVPPASGSASGPPAPGAASGEVVLVAAATAGTMTAPPHRPGEEQGQKQPPQSPAPLELWRRERLQIGDSVEVYSETRGEWVLGEVVMPTNGMPFGDVIGVKYCDGSGDGKNMARNSERIRERLVAPVGQATMRQGDQTVLGVAAVPPPKSAASPSSSVASVDDEDILRAAPASQRHHVLQQPAAVGGGSLLPRLNMQLNLPAAPILRVPPLMKIVPPVFLPNERASSSQQQQPPPQTQQQPQRRTWSVNVVRGGPTAAKGSKNSAQNVENPPADGGAGGNKLLSSDILIDPGELEYCELLGSGGFGSVHRGFYRATTGAGGGTTVTHEVAIKKLYTPPGMSMTSVRCSEGEEGGGSSSSYTSKEEEIIQEFAKEVRMLQKLRHDRLVSILGACCDLRRGELCMVLEYMSNGNLHSLLHGGSNSANNNPRFDHFQADPAARANPYSCSPTTIKIGLHILEGLHFLHVLANLETTKKPVVHRDLKSMNVVLDSRWNAKLCDFGLTQTMEKTHITRKEQEGGSPRYMAPELFQSGGSFSSGLGAGPASSSNLVADRSCGPSFKITEKVDIWAAGCLLAELFLRKLPHEECTNLQQVIAKLLVQRRGAFWFPEGRGLDGLEKVGLLHLVARSVEFDSRARSSAEDMLNEYKSIFIFEGHT